MAKQRDIIVKLLGIGDCNVGKTCLIFRFAEDGFLNEYGSTIGIDFKIRKLTIDGVNIRIQLWDTAGQERFETITRHYFRQAQGIFVVYDISNEKTFRNVRKWVEIARECAPDDAEMLLIGNKTDKLPSYRAVTVEQGEKLAKQLKIPFMETSAKDDYNVDDAFVGLTKRVLKKQRKNSQGLLFQEDSDANEFVSDLLKKQDKSWCC